MENLLMSMIIEIQKDCCNSNVKLSDLLRKCLYLAYKIKSEDFIQWICPLPIN